MDSKSPQKYIYLSALNVLSCFSVIMLHCNGVFWSRPSGRLWFTSNLIETLFYFAVPIFFMCSGITLLDYPQRYTTKEYFRKRINKTFIPFVAWSIVSFFDSTFYSLKFNQDIDWNLLHIVANIFNTKYLSVYWFFIPLFAVYLSIPIFANIKFKEIIYTHTILIGIIFVSILPLIFKILSLDYNTAITPSIVGGYMMYPLLGYVLNRKKLTPPQRFAIYCLGILGWLAHFAGTLILSAPNEIDSTFKGYLNIPTVLQTCAIFTFVKYVTEISLSKNMLFSNIILWLSKRTFGIYLVHMYLINYISELFKIDTATIKWRIAGAISIFFVSSAIIWLLQKIPVLRKIVP